MCTPLGSRNVDQDTVKKSLFSYNQVVRDKYVASDTYIRIETDSGEQQTISPENVCEFHTNYCNYINDLVFTVNVRSAADDYSFNELDELEHTSSWNPRCDSVLDNVSPSDYLKHQQQAIIAYVEVNQIVVDAETHL